VTMEARPMHGSPSSGRARAPRSAADSAGSDLLPPRPEGGCANRRSPKASPLRHSICSRHATCEPSRSAWDRARPPAW
jgi:hypothetical protein